MTVVSAISGRPFDTYSLTARRIGRCYTVMREPMMTVRSRGRPKYSAASAVMREVATKRRLRHAAHPGCVADASSIVERKYDASSTSSGHSRPAVAASRSTAGTLGSSM